MEDARLFVMLMEDKSPLTREVVVRHVAHLRRLDATGHLALCGFFEDYPGGMVVLQAENLEAARHLAEQDPFIAEGFKDYTVRTFMRAKADNGYLLD